MSLAARILLVLGLLGISWLSARAQTFCVATYNLQNYLTVPVGSRPAKSEEAKAKIRESIRATGADVLALQEVGGTNALLELRESLRREGCDFPFWELVTAWDTNIQVAVLSRFPITARRSHPKDSFLHFGRRHFVKRGFVEIDVQVNNHYTFTLLTAHLKSKLPALDGDEQELREEEAALLRAKIDAILNARPNANLIVAGDLNDTHDSKVIRTVIGRRNALVDTRPSERDMRSSGPTDSSVAWTHHYRKEDSYARIDYLLVSRGMAREWITNRTFIVRLPDWNLASDHRPIVATFSAEDR